MTLQTRIRFSMGGLLLLLILVGLAGFFGSRFVGGLATYYSQSLIPAILQYSDMRTAASDLQLAVYETGVTDLDERLTQARSAASQLLQSTTSGPFQDDTEVTSRVRRTSDILIRMADEVETHRPGTEVSNELQELFQQWRDNESEAEYTINYVISTVDGQIQSALGTIINVISGIAAVSVVVFGFVAFGLSRLLQRGISDLLASFRAVASGNMTVRADERPKNEFGELARHFNQLAGNLAATLGQLSGLVSELHGLAGEFNQASRNYSERAQLQSDDTHQVATAMTEMSATIREVAQNAEETAHRAGDANQQADHSRQVITQAVASAQSMQGQMTTLAERIATLKGQTDAITSVVKTINDIAEQTNLLALNAAIEAARAGEQGRGFAVVADEVRNLSVKTAESTKEIEAVIGQLQSQSDEAALAANDSAAVVASNVSNISEIGEGLTQILDAVASISTMSELIATTAEEQSKVAEDMNVNVVRISDVSSKNAEETQHLVTGIERIDSMTGELRELIDRYQL
ncbi:MAG: methyl-accepting chemotaxis protein [Saccharospirillum sp.]